MVDLSWQWSSLMIHNITTHEQIWEGFYLEWFPWETCLVYCAGTFLNLYGSWEELFAHPQTGIPREVPSCIFPPKSWQLVLPCIVCLDPCEFLEDVWCCHCHEKTVLFFQSSWSTWHLPQRDSGFSEPIHPYLWKFDDWHHYQHPKVHVHFIRICTY